MTNPLLEAARDLRSDIDARAVKAGGDPVPRETVETLVDAGIYGAVAPRDVGGAELSLPDAIDVFAEVARADGSAGWCLMASATSVSFFGAYTDLAFASRVFADGVPTVAFGSPAPRFGSGTRDGDGFRVSGRYAFGSGIHCARWVGAAFVPEGADPDDLLGVRFTAVPAEEARLLGNWDVMGLQATASYDYEVRDARVPEGGTFSFAAPVRRRGGPTFELGVLPITAAGHAGFAIGVVRRMLDELTVLARSKQRFGAGHTLADSERFQQALATLDARSRSGAAWVRESYERAERSAAAPGGPDRRAVLDARQAVVHVTQDGADIAREAYLLAGTSALRAGPLQRCFRDLHAASQHFVVGASPTLELAQLMIGSAPDSALDA